MLGDPAPAPDGALYFIRKTRAGTALMRLAEGRSRASRSMRRSRICATVRYLDAVPGNVVRPLGLRQSDAVEFAPARGERHVFRFALDAGV